MKDKPSFLEDSKMRQESGQVVIILLLVMVLALAIGLSVIGRSVNEIASSTKTEESSRAFSAAEAGIERALQLDTSPGGTYPSSYSFTLGPSLLTNQSQAEVKWDADLPKPGIALEYPPIGKGAFAQFWLANPDDVPNNISSCGGPNPIGCYVNGNFKLYFGDPKPSGQADYYTQKPSDAPAVEVNVIIYSGTKYVSKQYFFDTYRGGIDGTRQTNNFSACKRFSPDPILTNNAITNNRYFYCQVTVPPDDPSYLSSGDYPVMVRIKVLYSDIAHPIALQPVGGSLPPQAKVFSSLGTAGGSQRRLQVFQQKAVMPQIFDYALFSAGTLDK